jgi:GT2 family glycosyltransferase
VATLSIAIVTYQPEIRQLTLCLKGLHAASGYARETELLSAMNLNLVDNSTDPKIRDKLRELLHDIWNSPSDTTTVITPLKNLGYGVANNLAIKETRSDYHLVLNPDVLLEEDAIYNALRFMEQHPEVVLLTPSAVNGRSEKEYLNKRYPGMLTLLIRGFVPASLRKRFRNKIAYYEMRDLSQDKVSYDIPLASGCFMFFRTSALKETGGFSDKFFLYFEDYDLSIRAHEHGQIAYVPNVKIMHFGGGAAKKGLKHVFLFIRSAISFFNLHGWRLW